MKRLFVLFTTVLCLCAVNKAMAYDFFAVNNDGDTIYYNITSSTPPLTVEVTYEELPSIIVFNEPVYRGDITIPESVTNGGNTYTVTAIGYAAFCTCPQLTSVLIPNSVTTIGESAFSNCTGLTSVTIPHSVTAIGKEVFLYCTSLTSIGVEPNNLNYISVDGILFNKLQDTLLQCPAGKTGSYIISNAVTTIEDAAFSHCSGLTSITIPNSVITIGIYAFAECSGLVSITIGHSVTAIKDAVFSGCTGLTSIIIPNSVTTIGKWAFIGCSSLISIIIPNAVTTIGNSSFSGCTNLTSITIGNSVRTIGGFAFSRCSGLTSITIPNSVTTIDDYAFSHCSGLISITIPNSEITIGKLAFAACNSLTGIYVKAKNPPSLGVDVFWDVSTTVPVHVPCGKETDYQNTSGWDYFTNITGDIPPFDITLQSNDTIMGAAYIIQTYTCTNDTAIIEAIPNSGYRFVQWNDSNNQTPRTITVTQDTTFMAVFEENVSIANIEAPPISLFPNPATDNIHIILPENISQAVFTLYDMQGKALIKQKINNQETIPVNNLASGIYIYHIRTSKQNYQGKLIRK